ncbi:hypothetical protein ACWCRF_34255 [Streptomyces sp. NPDC002405]|uniref:hypothetical protein n=1 Tax=unclassified Streptomyces TaxID=2593676 RepID=UPI0036996987
MEPSWATPTITAAQHLVAHLTGHDHAVLGADRGYTRTHQIVVDATALGGGAGAINRLACVSVSVQFCGV